MVTWKHRAEISRKNEMKTPQQKFLQNFSRKQDRCDLVGWHGNQRDNEVTGISCTLIQRYDNVHEVHDDERTIYRFLPRACHPSLSFSPRRSSFLCPTSRSLFHCSRESTIIRHRKRYILPSRFDSHFSPTLSQLAALYSRVLPRDDYRAVWLIRTPWKPW